MSVSAALSDVGLNEVMSNPLGPESSDEYVELFNCGPDSINLSGWSIAEGGDRDFLLGESGSWLRSKAYALILDPSYAGSFDSLLRDNTLLFSIDDASFGSGGFSNSRVEELVLLDSNGLEADFVRLPESSVAGLSWERHRLSDCLARCDTCWSTGLTPGGTPGFRNSRVPGPNDIRLHHRDSGGLWLEANGDAGFQGLLQWRVEEHTRLFREHNRAVDLGNGTQEYLPWPPLERPGVNRVRLLAQMDSMVEFDHALVLLDSLLWQENSLSPLIINELMPDASAADWVELCTRGSDSLRLDGMFLRTHRDSFALSGWLAADQKLLISGELSGARGNYRWLDLSISLLSDKGELAVLNPAGYSLESCRWDRDQHPGGKSLERLPGFPKAELASSWHYCLDPQLQTAGTLNSLVVPASARGFGFNLPRTRFSAANGEVLRVGILSSQGMHHGRVQIFDLSGVLRRKLLDWQPVPAQWWLYWNGLDSGGNLLAPGIYVLQLQSTMGEDLRPVVLLP